MQFREVKSSLVALLGAAAAGRWRTLGYSPKALAAEQVIDASRTVQVVYGSGEFPKGGGAIGGPFAHVLQFRLELVAGAAAQGDLSVLNDEAASAADVIAALAGFREAAATADDSFDEMADLVWNAICDARNRWLGRPRGTVADAWVERIEKGEPATSGNEYVLVPGTIVLSAKVSEDVQGETPVDADVDLGSTLTEIETHAVDSDDADPAPAEIRGGRS